MASEFLRSTSHDMINSDALCFFYQQAKAAIFKARAATESVMDGKMAKKDKDSVLVVAGISCKTKEVVVSQVPIPCNCSFLFLLTFTSQILY